MGSAPGPQRIYFATAYSKATISLRSCLNVVEKCTKGVWICKILRVALYGYVYTERLQLAWSSDSRLQGLGCRAVKVLCRRSASNGKRVPEPKLEPKYLHTIFSPTAWAWISTPRLAAAVRWVFYSSVGYPNCPCRPCWHTLNGTYFMLT